MAERSAVVTGIGLVNAAGTGCDAVWDTVASGRSRIATITRFDAAGMPVKVAGQVDGFSAHDFIPRRFVVKTDRFTHYALAASHMALEDAGLDLDACRRDRVGVWMGNDTGGWDLAERGFRELHQQGAAMVNPWGATAWFPTAPQGFMSIRHKVTGYSKSFVCDRASGAAAIHFALRAIRAGHIDVAFVGGCEAPLTPLGVTAYHETGELSVMTDPRLAYRPFDVRRSGLVLGEGSAVLVVEEARHAARRGARAYGELLAGAMTFDPDPARGTAMERAIRMALGAAALGADEVDLVLAEGCGTRAGDALEARALAAALAGRRMPVRVACPKAAYGHLFGASGATDVACALMAIRRRRLPVTAGLDEPDGAPGLEFVTRPAAAEVAHVLVNARSREGANAALVIGPGDGDA